MQDPLTGNSYKHPNVPNMSDGSIVRQKMITSDCQKKTSSAGMWQKASTHSTDLLMATEEDCQVSNV